MYSLNGNYCFPIYWMNIPLPMFGFDHVKFDALEIRALVVLDAFQVVKLKDLLHIVDDLKKNYKLLGNAYICLLYSSVILLFYLSELYFVHFFSADMTSLKLSK